METPAKRRTDCIGDLAVQKRAKISDELKTLFGRGGAQARPPVNATADGRDEDGPGEASEIEDNLADPVDDEDRDPDFDIAAKINHEHQRLKAQIAKAGGGKREASPAPGSVTKTRSPSLVIGRAEELRAMVQKAIKGASPSPIHGK